MNTKLDTAKVTEMLRGWLQHALDNPKTTLQSVLTSGLAITGFLMASGRLSAANTAMLGGLQIALKTALGVAQTDAGQAKATLPGQVDPEMVPAHEEPDNPAAKPVAKP